MIDLPHCLRRNVKLLVSKQLLIGAYQQYMAFRQKY